MSRMWIFFIVARVRNNKFTSDCNVRKENIFILCITFVTVTDLKAILIIKLCSMCIM